MKLDIDIIPHSQQRYAGTVGDYWQEADTIYFRVSQMSDRRYEMLVLLHEMIEFWLVRLRGVKLDEIDEFDIAYEATRGNRAAPCGCPHGLEPGDDRHAPYHREHQVAEICERLLALFLGVSWADYAPEVESL